MDFPGGALTNISIFDGFANIYWRIYAEEGSVAPPSTDGIVSRHHILKHLSRLKDLELKLRNLDCLVSAYPRRLGLWVFSSTPGFESLNSLNQNSTNPESNSLLICGTSLKVSAAGAASAAEFFRVLSVDNQNTSASRKPQPAPTPGRGELSSSHATPIYAGFIAAVAGTVTLHLIRQNGAIPLGLQTFYTAIDRSSSGNPIIDNDGIDSVPALTGLKVELTPAGKVLISLSTFHQEGLARLRSGNVHADLDVWLAPNGTVARLVSTRYPLTDVLSPNSQNPKSAPDMFHHATDTKPKVWQSTILEWLSSYGLPTAGVEDETWVEVEVLEPFYAKLAAPEQWRQLDRNQPSNPLKRIPWPLRYCFRRATGANLLGVDGIDISSNEDTDPIRFAEDWLAASDRRKEKTSTENSTSQGHQSKTQDILSPLIEVPENLESLARIVQHADHNLVSLFYPTPPDGALLPPGAAQINISDNLGNDAADATQPHATSERGVHLRHRGSEMQHRSDPDGAMTAFITPNGLGVGSGLYDTNDDEDLFGEMNDKEFGLNGIDDADFSFFDEPDLDHAKKEKIVEDAAEFSPDARAKVKTVTDADQNTEEDVAEEQAERDTVEAGDTNNGTQLPALSQVGSTNTSQMPEYNEPSAAPITPRKHVASPPLSPTEIKKILFSKAPTHLLNKERPSSKEGASNNGLNQSTRKQSGYGPISFEQNLVLSDQKYITNGSFFFSRQEFDKGLASSDTAGIPIVGIPRAATKWNHLITTESRTKDIKPNNKRPNPSYRSRSASTSSDESLDVGSNSDYDAAFSPNESNSLKRKRQASDAADSTASSLQALSIEEELDLTGFKEESSIFFGNYLSLFSDWSLIGYFSIRKYLLSQVLVRKEDQITLAQLLVDQITQSSLCHRIDGYSAIPDLRHEFPLQAVLEDLPVIGKGERLDFNAYIAIQDNTSVVLPETSTLRHPPQRKEIKSSISKIPPPHLRVRRGRDTLDLLPPAIPFWETFGLEPASGPKDIAAYCIYPTGAKEGADAFMNRFSLLYTSCGLGKHNRGEGSKKFENGLGHWQVSSDKNLGYSQTMQGLRALCESLGNTLSKAPPVKDNFVLYVINPYPHGSAYADICAAFLQLFNKFVKEIDHQQPKSEMNELVLQIVPLSFVSSAYSMVVPDQMNYLNLALEVYNRCTSRDPVSSILGYAPPVLLADPVPRSISFKLAPERSSPFAEGRTLHIALSRSLDRRWITVAWSDSLGSFQLSMSYCLKAKISIASRPLAHVRKEIWETTEDIMGRFQTKWKIFLVRTEAVDSEEIEAWVLAVETYNQSKPMPAELTILTANVASSLGLELTAPQGQLNNLNPQLATTPVSSPHANAGSPDQYGTVATPTSGGATGSVNPLTPTDPSTAIEPDSDTMLIDYSDETWGAVLSHRLSNSSSITELRSCLASGYILRRDGTVDSRGGIAMSVNIIYTQRNSVPSETVLKDCLSSYRDLATLARAKGLLIVQSNTLPWHIATAVRGAELLSYIF